MTDFKCINCITNYLNLIIIDVMTLYLYIKTNSIKTIEQIFKSMFKFCFDYTYKLYRILCI